MIQARHTNTVRHGVNNIIATITISDQNRAIHTHKRDSS